MNARELDEQDLESMSIMRLNYVLDGMDDGVAFRARGSLGNEDATIVGETLGDQDVVYAERGEPYSEEEEGQSYPMRNIDKI